MDGLPCHNRGQGLAGSQQRILACEVRNQLVGPEEILQVRADLELGGFAPRQSVGDRRVRNSNAVSRQTATGGSVLPGCGTNMP